MLCIEKFPPNYSRIVNALSVNPRKMTDVFQDCLPEVSTELLESLVPEFGYERFSKNTEKIILRSPSDPEYIYKTWKTKPRIVDDMQFVDFRSGWVKVKLSYLRDVTALDLFKNIQRQNGVNILSPVQVFFAPQLDAFLKKKGSHSNMEFPLLFREPLDDVQDHSQEVSQSYQQLLESAVCVTQESGELWGVIFRVGDTGEVYYLNDFCFRNVARCKNTHMLRSHDSTAHLIDTRKHPEFFSIAEYLSKRPSVVFSRSQYASGRRCFQCASSYVTQRNARVSLLHGRS